MAEAPRVVVIGGPNGAGKSTASPSVLRDLGVQTFVNADTIARGLSEFHPEEVAVAAGRIMLERLHELAAQRRDFAFETTLASRTFAKWLAELRSTGYRAYLFYVAIPSADMAVSRVRARVGHGGHDVPEETIRRRFTRSLKNLFSLYLDLVDEWQVVDNSMGGVPRPIAQSSGRALTVTDEEAWKQLRAHANG